MLLMIDDERGPLLDQRFQRLGDKKLQPRRAIALAEGKADVRRRRRRLERLAARALGDLSHDEARRVASALAELQTLLERR